MCEDRLCFGASIRRTAVIETFVLASGDCCLVLTSLLNFHSHSCQPELSVRFYLYSSNNISLLEVFYIIKFCNNWTRQKNIVEISALNDVSQRRRLLQNHKMVLFAFNWLLHRCNISYWLWGTLLIYLYYHGMPKPLSLYLTVSHSYTLCKC